MCFYQVTTFFARNVLSKHGWIHNCCIEVSQGIVHSLNTQLTQKECDISVDTLIPGFIDIQVNGGGGVLFNQQTNAQAIATIFDAHRQFGTTAMLPTLITDSYEVMQSAARAISEYRNLHPQGGVVGVHFEGPWLNKQKRGVHSESFIREPDDATLDLLRNSSLGKVMVTVAPETIPVGVIKEMVKDDIIVFLGHSNASFEQAMVALEAGASGFTHLYNAMSPMTSRAPGMVGAALSSDSSYAGLIVDGHHVASSCCNVAIKSKSVDKVCLVTDAMALAASEKTSMPFFDQVITKQNGKLTIDDGTLAGSCLTMFDAFSNAQSMCDISLQQASTMASYTPARALGLDDKLGSIEVGKQADFIVLNKQQEIESVWQGGCNI